MNSLLGMLMVEPSIFNCKALVGFFVQLFYRAITLIFKVLGLFADLMNIAFYIFSGIDLEGGAYNITISATGDKTNILDYFLFSETMRRSYFWLALAGLLLIVIFTIYKIIKQDYFEKGGPRSKGPIFRNVAISCISFLLVIPIFWLIVHASSLLALVAMDAMGMDVSQLAGAKIFMLSWSDSGKMATFINNALTVENGNLNKSFNWMWNLDRDTLFTIMADGKYIALDVETIKVKMANGKEGDKDISILGRLKTNSVIATDESWEGALADGFHPINYGDGTTSAQGATFFWYIYLLGVIVAIKTLYKLLLAMLQRIFMLMGLFLVAPAPISQYVLDDGEKFKDWLKKSIQQGLRVVVAFMSFSIYLIVLNLVGEIDFVAAFTSASDAAKVGANVSPRLLTYNGGLAMLVEEPTAFGTTGAATQEPDILSKLANAFLRVFMLIGAGGAVTDLDLVLSPLISGAKNSLEDGDTGDAAKKVGEVGMNAVKMAGEGALKLAGVAAGAAGSVVGGLAGGVAGAFSNAGAAAAGRDAAVSEAMKEVPTGTDGPEKPNPPTTPTGNGSGDGNDTPGAGAPTDATPTGPESNDDEGAGAPTDAQGDSQDGATSPDGEEKGEQDKATDENKQEDNKDNDKNETQKKVDREKLAKAAGVNSKWSRRGKVVSGLIKGIKGLGNGALTLGKGALTGLGKGSLKAIGFDKGVENGFKNLGKKALGLAGGVVKGTYGIANGFLKAAGFDADSIVKPLGGIAKSTKDGIAGGYIAARDSMNAQGKKRYNLAKAEAMAAIHEAELKEKSNAVDVATKAEEAAENEAIEARQQADNDRIDAEDANAQLEKENPTGNSKKVKAAEAKLEEIKQKDKGIESKYGTREEVAARKEATQNDIKEKQKIVDKAQKRLAQLNDPNKYKNPTQKQIDEINDLQSTVSQYGKDIEEGKQQIKEYDFASEQYRKHDEEAQKARQTISASQNLEKSTKARLETFSGKSGALTSFFDQHGGKVSFAEAKEEASRTNNKELMDMFAEKGAEEIFDKASEARMANTRARASESAAKSKEDRLALARQKSQAAQSDYSKSYKKYDASQQLVTELNKQAMDNKFAGKKAKQKEYEYFDNGAKGVKDYNKEVKEYKKEIKRNRRIERYENIDDSGKVIVEEGKRKKIQNPEAPKKSKYQENRFNRGAVSEKQFNTESGEVVENSEGLIAKMNANLSSQEKRMKEERERIRANRSLKRYFNGVKDEAFDATVDKLLQSNSELAPELRGYTNARTAYNRASSYTARRKEYIASREEAESKYYKKAQSLKKQSDLAVSNARALDAVIATGKATPEQIKIINGINGFGSNKRTADGKTKQVDLTEDSSAATIVRHARMAQAKNAANHERIVERANATKQESDKNHEELTKAMETMARTVGASMAGSQNQQASPQQNNTNVVNNNNSNVTNINNNNTQAPVADMSQNVKSDDLDDRISRIQSAVDRNGTSRNMDAIFAEIKHNQDHVQETVDRIDRKIDSMDDK